MLTNTDDTIFVCFPSADVLEEEEEADNQRN